MLRRCGTDAQSMPCSRPRSPSSGYALLQAQVAVFRGSVVTGGRGVAGADVFSARCLRLPLGVSSTGAGGWVERAFRPRWRRRSAGGRLTAEVASGGNAGVRGRSSGDAGRLAAVSEHCRSPLARNLTSAGRDRRRPRESGRAAGRRRARRCQPRAPRASRRRRPPRR